MRDQPDPAGAAVTSGVTSGCSRVVLAFRDQGLSVPPPPPVEHTETADELAREGDR